MYIQYYSLACIDNALVMASQNEDNAARGMREKEATTLGTITERVDG